MIDVLPLEAVVGGFYVPPSLVPTAWPSPHCPCVLSMVDLDGYAGPLGIRGSEAGARTWSRPGGPRTGALDPDSGRGVRGSGCLENHSVDPTIFELGRDLVALAVLAILFNLGFHFAAFQPGRTRGLAGWRPVQAP